MNTTQLQFSAIVKVGNITGRFWIVDGMRRELFERQGLPLFGFDSWAGGNDVDYVLSVGDTVIVAGLKYRIDVKNNEIILV